MPTQSGPVVAVDVGGTFTDVCVLEPESGRLEVAKVPSTADPIDGVMAGVEQAGIDLGQTELFSHGTTVATNALITRNFPKAAMVTTRGFRDVVEIGRGTRDDLWDAYKDNAAPLIRRRDRLEVRIISSSTINCAIMKGHTPLTMSSMLMRDTPQTTLRTMPTGGVIRPIELLMMKSTPK